MTGRLTIGLYNTYDRVRYAEAHRRAVCRAGALAWAFEANLACFGFPFEAGAEAADGPEPETARDLADWLADTTTIGESGRYLRDLADAGRFDVFDLPDPGFPPQLGKPVATTRRADDDRAWTVPQAADALLHDESLLVVFGLGTSGLSDDVLDHVQAHLDVTGRRLSLETATAMGAVVAAVHWAVRMRQSDSR